MIYKKVSPGDKKKKGFPAAVYNGMVDILNAGDSGISDVPFNTASFSERTILVENTTDEDVPAFGVLSLDGFLFQQDEKWGQDNAGSGNEEPEATEPGIDEILSNGFCFKGIKPKQDKPVAVTLEDIASGNIGKAVVDGPAAVAIEMKNSKHLYAEIVEGETGHLQSSDSGTIRILGVKKEPYQGLQLPGVPNQALQAAAVVLGTGGGTEYFEGEIESRNGGTYTVAIYKNASGEFEKHIDESDGQEKNRTIEATTIFVRGGETLDNGTVVGVTWTSRYGYRITHCEY